MKYTINNNILYRQVEEKSFLFDPSTERYFGLNSTGQTIWKFLKSPRGIDEVVAYMASLYSVEMGALKNDVMSLISELKVNGLIIQVS